MTWTKLDENFPLHPKILAAGPVAELLQIHALIYCNRLGTDGLVPASAVRHLIHVPERRPVQKLVELGIWEVVDGGYQIHDFLDYQPSRAEVEAKRKQKASAGQAGGLASGKARASRSVSSSVEAKSKPVPSPFRSEPFNASSVGSLGPTDAALDLAVQIADVLNVSALAPLEIQACEQALVEFPYLIPAELVERAKQHQDACRARQFPVARTMQGLWEAWRSQNDYNADHGRHKARSQGTSAMSKAFS